MKQTLRYLLRWPHILVPILALVFLWPCRDGFFLGGCGLGKIIIVAIILISVILYSTLTFLLAKIFKVKGRTPWLYIGLGLLTLVIIAAWQWNDPSLLAALLYGIFILFDKIALGINWIEFNIGKFW